MRSKNLRYMFLNAAHKTLPMTLSLPCAVILDMDGTTVRHLNPRVLAMLERADDAIYHTRRYISQILSWMGVQKYRTRFRTSRKPRLIVHRVLHKLRRKPVEQIVEPCPGIIDLLELLNQKGIPVGLISNGMGKGYGHDILTRFDLAPLFASTLFREDSMRAKPDPEPLLKSIDCLGIQPGETRPIWYIGDRAKDMVTAAAAKRASKMNIVPIAYGLHAGAQLLRSGQPVDHIILSYEDWFADVYQIVNGTPYPS